MKFYVETASGKSPLDSKWTGFDLKNESFMQSPNMNDPKVPLEKVEAFTLRLSTVEELLTLVNFTSGAVVVEWQAQYPPAKPRQHIPVLRIVDDYL